MSDIPLTPLERDFAEENHNLIYKFLNNYHLPDDEFYDIVVFGYLKAVKAYNSNTLASKASFSTIAWKQMMHELSHHFEAQKRQKRLSDTVSLQAMNENVSTAGEFDGLPPELEMQLLLHALAAKTSQRQQDILRLRDFGYPLKRIAKKQGVSIRCVKQELDNARTLLMEICQE